MQVRSDTNLLDMYSYTYKLCKRVHISHLLVTLDFLYTIQTPFGPNDISIFGPHYDFCSLLFKCTYDLTFNRILVTSSVYAHCPILGRNVLVWFWISAVTTKECPTICLRKISTKTWIQALCKALSDLYLFFCYLDTVEFFFTPLYGIITVPTKKLMWRVKCATC